MTNTEIYSLIPLIRPLACADLGGLLQAILAGLADVAAAKATEIAVRQARGEAAGRAAAASSSATTSMMTHRGAP